jgi:hypothetical protein
MKKAFLLVVMFVMLVGAASAGDKFYACLYEMEAKSKDIKQEEWIKSIKDDLIKTLKNSGIFILVPAGEIKKITDEIALKKGSSYDKAKEVSEFYGIDLLISGKIQGEKKSDDQLLEELFSEGSSDEYLLTVKLDVYDLAEKKSIFRKELKITGKADAEKLIETAVWEFKKEFVKRRGRIIKIKGDKLAINLGANDGLKSDNVVTFYEADKPIKLGDLIIIPRGKKLMDGVATTVIERGALVELEFPNIKKVKEGYYVEFMVNKELVKSDEAGVPEEKQEASKSKSEEVKKEIPVKRSGDF